MTPAPDGVDYLVKMLGVTDFNSGGIFQNQPDGLRRLYHCSVEVLTVTEGRKGLRTGFP